MEIGMETKREDIYTALDPRMKLILLILFTTANYISRSTWVLLWDYLLIVGLYLVRHLWKGAWKTSILFGSFLVLELLISYIPHDGIKAELALIIFFWKRIPFSLVMENGMQTKFRFSTFSPSLKNMIFPKG